MSIYKLHFLQHFWIKDGKAYVLTFTTEEKTYDKFKVLGEKILHTFKTK